MSKPFTEVELPGGLVVRLVTDGMRSTCERCGKEKPMEEFGMRVMDKSARPLVIRRQPQCSICRGLKPVNLNQKSLF